MYPRRSATTVAQRVNTGARLTVTVLRAMPIMVASESEKENVIGYGMGMGTAYHGRSRSENRQSANRSLAELKRGVSKGVRGVFSCTNTLTRNPLDFGRTERSRRMPHEALGLLYRLKNG